MAAPRSTPAPGRRAGVLLHITSLPGPFGIGDLGPSSHRWIDLLAEAGQSLWQILPLHPPGDHDSPYQALSTFAGNPLLISPELLVSDGWLKPVDLPAPLARSDRANFRAAASIKRKLLSQAYETFRAARSRRARSAFEQFTRAQSAWLDDFALFMALCEAKPDTAWQSWPREMRSRSKSVLAAARRELADSIQQHQFTQFLFFGQLDQLRAHARASGIAIIGDLPIFVSLQSADVWANPHLFQLDRNLQPTATAGVPPDHFSSDGQSWNNPLYNWRAMQRDGFMWWTDRMKAAVAMSDIIRIDHFRGLEAYWSIPASSATARGGKWIKAPGRQLLETLHHQFGNFQAIAEDLGVITPEVERLRDHFHLPGMRILQFAFGDDAANLHLPHNYIPNTVVYTATHDNDTTQGWLKNLPAAQRKNLLRYVPRATKTSDALWPLIRLAWSSVADRAVLPAQDLLGLGTSARMNYPGRPAGNWAWRLRDFEMCKRPLSQLHELTEAYGRAKRA